jgi:nitroreductase
MEAIDAIHTRVSASRFDSEDLPLILAFGDSCAGLWTPDPWRFVVIEGDDREEGVKARTEESACD